MKMESSGEENAEDFTKENVPGALQGPIDSRLKQYVENKSINQNACERSRKKIAGERNENFHNVADALHIPNGACSKQYITKYITTIDVKTGSKKQQNKIGQKRPISRIDARKPLPYIKRKRNLKKLSGKFTDIGSIPTNNRNEIVEFSEQKTDKGTDRETGCPSSRSENIPEIKPLAYCRFIARFPVLSFGEYFAKNMSINNQNFCR